MEFISNNRRFSLTVEGYQFPDLTESGDRYDRNWLNIHCEVSLSRRCWQFTDPFMLTWDVEMWAEWMDELATGTQTHDFAVAYDGVVSLRFKDIIADAYQILVQFTDNGRPLWTKQRKYSLSFSVTADQLRTAAASLRDDLRRFPPRDPNTFRRRNK
jgi:hypothetical protein